MKHEKIGTDNIQNKDIYKIIYSPEELPKNQLFNAADVAVGNPASNIAVAFVYTWKEDRLPDHISAFFQRISNYAALTGIWRTTNGGRYALSNILANPNINKILLLVFGQDDNGHLLVNALENHWKFGTDNSGLIKNCRAANPKFEQVPIDALERIRRQADLVIARNLGTQFDEIERLVRAMLQEPENAIPISSFSSIDLTRVSNVVSDDVLYDDGARFTEPYTVNLTKGTRSVEFESKTISTILGRAVQAKNLDDALTQLASFIFKNGSVSIDMRNLKMAECRSISIMIENPLEKIPEGFSREYIDKYVDEFMNGMDIENEFAYTYHDRIFKTWGDQVDKIIKVLRKSPSTRRACISLWDPRTDLDSSSPPCLNFIWFCVRENKLEMHVVYRSHHLATVSGEGGLMIGEGAFVPNLFALGTLQKHVADSINVPAGALVLTDFSGHIHIADI